MSTVAVLDVVARLVAFDVAGADRESLRAALADSKRLGAWRDAFDARVVAAMSATESYPEQAISDAQQVPFRDAERLVRRAEVLAQAPAFAVSLEAGRITAAHVDVLGRALQKLEPAHRPLVLAQADVLVRIAERMVADSFQRELKRRVQQLTTDDGMARFEAQRRATTLRTWTDEVTGMWCLQAEFDPVTAKLLAPALRGKTEAMFRDTTPPHAPSDPVARQQHLAALALAALVLDPGGRGTVRWDATVVVDVSDQPTEIDWGLPVDIPVPVRDALLRDARIECVIVANGRILYAPGKQDEGRDKRVASRAQRRMLRALYRCCGMPGCTVPFDRAKMHHVLPWEDGGRTDLANLLPLCPRHHHCVHDLGWVVEMGPDRTLTVRLPDGQVLSTGPPSRRRPAA